jgi:NAD(P)-dependent dehydrogenase (short-subunit alcohol dehydrogenase family)
MYAGISGISKRINEISTNDWNYVIDVNLKGTFLCSREALKYMLQNSDAITTSTNITNNYCIINMVCGKHYN